MRVLGPESGDLSGLYPFDGLWKDKEVVAEARIKSACLAIAGVDEKFDAVAVGYIGVCNAAHR